MSFSRNPFRKSTHDNKTLRPITGWPFERLASLDIAGAPGLLAHTASCGVLKRQAIFAVLSQITAENTSAFLHLVNCASIGEALRTRYARQLVAAAFAVEQVPNGYLRALARIGDSALSPPDLYAKLFDLMVAGGPQAHAIRYCGSPLTSSEIAVVDLLDPVLVSPESLHSLSAYEARTANEVAAFLRRVCSAATDDALTQAARQHLKTGNLSAFATPFIRAADRFPPPPFVGVGALQPVTSADQMISLGTRLRNCLGNTDVISEVLLRLKAYYFAEVELLRLGATPVVVELEPAYQASGERLWQIQGVHTTKHRTLPHKIALRIIEPLLQAGALINVNLSQHPADKRTREALGVFRWNPLRWEEEIDGAEPFSAADIAELEERLERV